MEHRQPLTSSITMIDARNNNNSSRNKKRTAKRQQLTSPSLTLKDQHISSVIISDLPSSSSSSLKTPRSKHNEHRSMKTPLGWTKKWTKWFSSCGSESVSHTNNNPIIKRARTKSENDVLKHGNLEQDEKKKLPTTSSSFAIGQNSNDNLDERPSRRSSHYYYHHQSNERVSCSSNVLYRDNTRRYSNLFFTSARVPGGRTSIAAIPLPTTTTTTTTSTVNTSQSKQPLTLSRSVDRLHNKSTRRELRYEEHNDYIPPPLYTIQCHPTIEHYTRSLNQSTYFRSNHRRSQIEAYPSSTTNNRVILPRPYSTVIPYSQSAQIMSKTSSSAAAASAADKTNKNTYSKLSECHSPLTPLENSSVKAPRRIESNYSQFPLQQEPVYANTQSLYDNILYPQSASNLTTRSHSQEKKSCASQTQLTWTMATFSSFVDLENPTAIIPQLDPSTLYSIVQHQPSHSPTPETTQPTNRISPRAQYLDDPNTSSHYQRPRSPFSSTSFIVEKRDGSFQTLLSIGPNQDIHSNRQLFIHDSTPSPISTGSSITPGQQQQQQRHHHHHRKHKSRNNTNSGNVSTRDVGLQVNIQTVKKITFTSPKSDESSLTTATTPSSPPTLKISPELKNVQTNTDPLVAKRDKSTSYESNLQVRTSSSQTTDSSPTTSLMTTTTTTALQTKAAQTANKTLRDQSMETNNLGLFVCDLSSLLQNGSDEPTALTIKRKS